MWIELTVDGQPYSFNADNLVSIRKFRGKSGGTIIEAVTPDSYHASESYDQVRQMLYPKTTERAAPVYADTSR